MRTRLAIVLAAIASLALLPLGAAAAQDNGDCVGPGDGSAIGEPTPCPTETETNAPPTQESPEPPDREVDEPGPAPSETETEEATPIPADEVAGETAALADTGIDAGVLAFVALGALVLGAVAVVLSRRRHEG